MSFFDALFEDKSQGAIDNAIAQAKASGLNNVSDEQVRRIKEAATQSGPTGDAARKVLGINL